MSKVNTDINQRWEEGTPQHPKAREIGEAIGRLDRKYGYDALCLSFGGDGDNGEHLIDMLSLYFELKEAGEDV